MRLLRSRILDTHNVISFRLGPFRCVWLWLLSHAQIWFYMLFGWMFVGLDLVTTAPD